MKSRKELFKLGVVTFDNIFATERARAIAFEPAKYTLLVEYMLLFVTSRRHDLLFRIELG